MMANTQHTVIGTTSPDAAPPSVGAHFILRGSGRSFLSQGTESVEDWGGSIGNEAIGRVYEDETLAIDPNYPLTLFALDDIRTFKLEFGAPQSGKVYKVEVIFFNPTAVPISVSTDVNGPGSLVGTIVVNASEFKSCVFLSLGFNWVISNTHTFSYPSPTA